jgi:hypothetical protein
MKTITGIIFTSLTIISLASAATANDGYTFVLDGKSYDPRFNKVNGESLSSGDVAYIDDIPLCLDEPGRYEFEIKDGITYRVLPDGKKVAVACAVSAKYDEPFDPGARFKVKPKVTNPMEKMDETALKALRGVSIGIWSEDVKKQLERLNLDKVCILIESFALSDGIPPVPQGVRTLVLDSGGTWRCEDMTGFTRLKKLRYLDLDDTMPDAFDFAVLKGMPLEFLSLPWASKTSNTDVLSTLTELKTLVANYCSFLGDGRWIGNLANLRTLYASHLRSTGESSPLALDLAALAGLKKIEAIHAQSTPIESLPSTPMPSFKQASLLLSGASKEMIDAFANANPQAIISHSMNAQLADRLSKADRFIVRTGGVCHRTEADEKKLYESREQKEISELANHFVVEESGSGGHCMCCGDPTFEFYDDDKCIAMIGFHHGRSIRWADGTWPGDGMLTSQSAGHLVDWLASHGYSGPKDQLLESRKQEAAQRRRQNRYAALLPTAVAEALENAGSVEEATAAFEKNILDLEKRAVLYLRLFGCDDGTWNLSSGLDQPLIEIWLPSIPQQTLTKVMLNLALKSEEGLGAIRWVFGEGHLELIKDDDKTFSAFAKFALTHPQESNRRKTLTRLRAAGTQIAITLLRDIMINGTELRVLDKDQVGEPGGQMTFYPDAITLPDGTPDSVTAALCLACLKDETSKQQIKTIKDSLSKDAQKEWEEILERLKAQ